MDSIHEYNSNEERTANYKWHQLIDKEIKNMSITDRIALEILYHTRLTKTINVNDTVCNLCTAERINTDKWLDLIDSDIIEWIEMNNSHIIKIKKSFEKQLTKNMLDAIEVIIV